MMECTPELVKKICDLLCDGVTLEEIGRMPDMPAANTIHDWKSANPDVRPKYVSEDVAKDIARAREIGYDTIASKTRETARGKGDSTGDVQRDKLIIHTDLQLLSKWTKKYSDKVINQHEGEDGGPVKHDVTVNFVSSKPKKDEK